MKRAMSGIIWLIVSIILIVTFSLYFWNKSMNEAKSIEKEQEKLKQQFRDVAVFTDFKIPFKISLPTKPLSSLNPLTLVQNDVIIVTTQPSDTDIFNIVKIKDHRVWFVDDTTTMKTILWNKFNANDWIFLYIDGYTINDKLIKKKMVVKAFDFKSEVGPYILSDSYVTQDTITDTGFTNDLTTKYSYITTSETTPYFIAVKYSDDSMLVINYRNMSHEKCSFTIGEPTQCNGLSITVLDNFGKVMLKDSLGFTKITTLDRASQDSNNFAYTQHGLILLGDRLITGIGERDLTQPVEFGKIQIIKSGNTISLAVPQIPLVFSNNNFVYVPYPMAKWFFFNFEYLKKLVS